MHCKKFSPEELSGFLEGLKFLDPPKFLLIRVTELSNGVAIPPFYAVVNSSGDVVFGSKSPSEAEQWLERALEEVKPKIRRVSKCGITTHYEAFCPVCKTVFAKRRHRQSLSAYLAKHEHYCANIPDASVFLYK